MHKRTDIDGGSSDARGVTHLALHACGSAAWCSCMSVLCTCHEPRTAATVEGQGGNVEAGHGKNDSSRSCPCRTRF